MTPSTAPLPVNNEDTPKVSPKGFSDVTETAGSQVASNSLLMKTIFSSLEEKDLLNWMTVSREHFHLVAGILYRFVRHAHLTQLWDIGCNIKRFQIYAQSVRIIRILHDCITDNDFITLLDQYDNLEEIHCDLDYDGIRVEELFIWDDREIIVTGCEPPYYLMEHDNFVQAEDYDLERLEIRSIGWKEQYLSEERGTDLLEWIIDEIDLRVPDLPFRSMTRLELPSVTFDLKSLETVLAGLPNLKSLRCSLDDRGLSNDGKIAYRKELKRLMKRYGTKLQELELRFARGGLFHWLDILATPQTLCLSAVMEPIERKRFEYMVTHTPKDRHEGSIRRLILKPTGVTVGKINPYEAAKALRWLLPSFCTIGVDTSMKSSAAPGYSRLEAWVDEFRSTLNTLQWEDDIKRRQQQVAMSKGWVHVENAPGVGNVRDAVDSGDMKDAPDRGDANSIPGSSGVGSTAGGGGKPNLWYVFRSETALLENYLAESFMIV